MGKKTVSTPQVIINNILYPIVPNTLTYTEGFGEYTVKGSSVGAGQTETVFSENAEDKISEVKFELYPTSENIKSAREWKVLLNENLIEFADDGFNKTFTISS